MFRSSTILPILFILFTVVSGCDQAQNDRPVPQWERVEGIADGEIYDVAIAAGGEVLASVEEEGVYRSIDGGDSWQEVLDGDAGTGSIDLAGGPEAAYAAFAGGTVYRSTDGGDTWTLSSGLPDSLTVIAVGVSPRNIVFLGTNGDGVLRSSDRGTTWEYVNEGLHDDWVKPFGFVSDSVVCAGVSNEGMSCSHDDGDHWRRTALRTNFVTAILPDSGGDILVCTSDDGVYRLDAAFDGEARQVSDGLANDNLNACVIDEKNRLYVGAWTDDEQRLFRTVDRETWQDVSGALEGAVIHSMAIGRTGRLFVGTDRGLFRGR